VIHVGELTLEERGAMELLESARGYLADHYSTRDRCEWSEPHYMTASNLLRELITQLRVQAAERRTR